MQLQAQAQAGYLLVSYTARNLDDSATNSKE